MVKISQTGELSGEIIFPTRNITCVEFVGTEQYVTSAAYDEGDARSRSTGGCPFKVHVRVHDLPHFPFKLSSGLEADCLVHYKSLMI